MAYRSILHPMIQGKLDPQHPLYLRSSYLMARIFYNLDQNHAAESTILPVAQIALTRLGPSHKFTIEVMGILSQIILSTGRLGDGERLMRYNL